MDNPFALVPDDQESIVELVKREVEQEQAETGFSVLDLDHCIREAVAVLWSSDVKTFVPLLATRHVRSCLRAGHCKIADW